MSSERARHVSLPPRGALGGRDYLDREVGGMPAMASAHARLAKRCTGRLTVGQGGTHAGNHVAIPMLMGGDYVHIPFDNYGGALLTNVLTGPVEPVEHRTFIKNRRLRCI